MAKGWLVWPLSMLARSPSAITQNGTFEETQIQEGPCQKLRIVCRHCIVDLPGWRLVVWRGPVVFLRQLLFGARASILHRLGRSLIAIYSRWPGGQCLPCLHMRVFWFRGFYEQPTATPLRLKGWITVLNVVTCGYQWLTTVLEHYITLCLRM